MSPNPEEVVNKEQEDHLVRADTTIVAQSAQEDSVNINKTQSKETLGEQSPEGPRYQGTTGEGVASARQETPSKRSSDSLRVGKTPKSDEDRYTYEELMDTCANIAADVANQGEIIKQQVAVIAQQKELLTKQGVDVEKLQKVVFHQFTEIQTLKKTVTRLM